MSRIGGCLGFESTATLYSIAVCVVSSSCKEAEMTEPKVEAIALWIVVLLVLMAPWALL